MASASLIISSTDSGGVVKLIRPADLVDSGVGVLKPLQQWIRDKVNERKMTPPQCHAQALQCRAGQ